MVVTSSMYTLMLVVQERDLSEVIATDQHLVSRHQVLVCPSAVHKIHDGLICLHRLLLALIKFEAAHLEVAIEDNVEESLFFIILIMYIRQRYVFTLGDNDVFGRDKFDFQTLAYRV